ncbi:MAG TPA: TonB-dependent receptor [Vicinamibacterales bacterium]|nr:TonB-dependent receptor [Vicinamibacterales bacterium]
MRATALGTLAATLLALCLTASPAFGQSEAANGVIEGTVVDPSGAVLPGVTVTLVNTDTGAERVVVTNERGFFRAPLLPLGTYRLVAELAGFRRYEQTGLALAAGQTVVLHVTLQVGELTEVVSVSAADAPLVDAGKIDAGRNLNEREIKNLPLVSRNPYNFALLQPAVSGFENPEFGVPRFSANGTLLRVNYQIDGNTNTQKDRAGLRLLPISEVMVREVKVVTSGYAPEFGQTTGLVYNAVTPSGTNVLRGAGSYRFRRKPFSAFPFFFPLPRTPENRPDTKVDTVTAEVGGPVVRDRLHYFVGFENTSRDLSAQRVITINREAAARIGLPPQPGVIPAEQAARFYIGKLDHQAGPAHRLTARYIRFTNDSPHNIGGGLNSTERSTDFLDAMNSAAVQLVSTFGHARLNELRIQFANRHQSRTTNELSGTGPAVTISGVANFGGPYASGADAGFDFRQDIWQIVDNFTWIRGTHSLKAGIDIQVVGDARTATLVRSYTFPSIEAYLAAVSGANRRSYTRFEQTLGDPSFEMSTRLYSAFVQDDWRLTPDFKLLYGVRYDLYDWPAGVPDAPFEFSRDFRSDINNWGPRVGLAWALGRDRRTVIRASTGLMYDQPLLAAFENAIQQTGAPARFNVVVAPTTQGAPDFPATLDAVPPGFRLPAQSIFTVDREFEVASTFQNNVQVERALGRDYAVTVGFVYVRGRHLPVITDINLVGPVGRLGDGRPIFSPVIGPATRMDPRFDHINVVQSIGRSRYRALTLQVSKRYSHGVQFDFSYAYGKGEDNAPLTTALSVQGDDGRSDPTDLDRDWGPNLMDVRHNFAGSLVAAPRLAGGPRLLRALVDDNQVGLLLQFNSGLPFNVRAADDLNRDGVLADRPNGIGRNAVYLPARWNVDLRYSRFVPVRGAVRLEILGELKNLFNTVQTASVNRIVRTSPLGDALVPVSRRGKDYPPTGGYEQRQFQLGFKVHF